VSVFRERAADELEALHHADHPCGWAPLELQLEEAHGLSGEGPRSVVDRAPACAIRVELEPLLRLSKDVAVEGHARVGIELARVRLALVLDQQRRAQMVLLHAQQELFGVPPRVCRERVECARIAADELQPCVRGHGRAALQNDIANTSLDLEEHRAVDAGITPDPCLESIALLAPVGLVKVKLVGVEVERANAVAAVRA